MGKKKRVYPCPWCDAEEVSVKGYQRHHKSKIVWICPVCRGPRPIRCHRAHLHEFDRPCIYCGRRKFRPMKKKGQSPDKPISRKKRRRQK